MKKIILALIIVVNLFLAGCFDYNDINRVIFVTAAVVDIDDEGKYVLYTEAFHSFRSNQTNAEKGDKLFFRMEGLTLFDAARDFNRQAAFKVDYTQMKAVIVTERVAEKGLNYIVDILERGQETILRAHIIVTDEEPSTILNFPIKQNEYIGLYLNELMENPFLVKMFRVDRLNQYLNQRYQAGHTHILSNLSIEENPVDARMTVDGGAIFVNDKLVGKIEEGKMQAWRFLTNRVDRGLIIFPATDITGDEELFMAVDTIHSSTKSDIEYDGNKIILKKSMTLKTSLMETQVPFVFNSENAEKIQQATEKVVKQNCEELFNQMKEKNIDIFDIEAQLVRKYPNIEIQDPITITELHLEINNQLMGSPNVTSFK
ncbi:Ger(x)C family spore germination protein [Alkaliphilus transvaalensis]|uniref:Ger(x)C family spore germination protein n=1 Tax=Alkaliphilus transvaalensis TaxID=114628 RepID=UPI00146FBBF4|nr:Ger(x)C family spore germination protein [Alkaliphilus transvaalensis]